MSKSYFVSLGSFPLPRFGCSFLVALLLRYASAKDCGERWDLFPWCFFWLSGLTGSVLCLYLENRHPSGMVRAKNAYRGSQALHNTLKAGFVDQAAITILFVAQVSYNCGISNYRGFNHGCKCICSCPYR